MSYKPVLVACTLVCLVLVSVPVGAEEDPPEKFQFFGYLTQAYGRSSRGSILGTEPSGTTDLGNVAIQFRWNKTARDAVVVQLAHERRGDDLFAATSDEVAVDWAFYERRLASNTRLKIGRLNIPLGIYNEVRDVGTLLPFFSLPISFYAGVPSSAETVDGISLAHTFSARSDWSLDAEMFVGGWDTIQLLASPGTKFGLADFEARAEEGIGVQFWLNSPFRGIRLGAGALHWLLDGPASLPERDSWNSQHLSLDLGLKRWVLRAEARHWDIRQDLGPLIGSPTSMPANSHRNGFYLQAGYWVNDRIGIFAQVESTSLKDEQDLIPGLQNFHKEGAVSLNYRFNPDALVRIEFHTSETMLPLGLPPTGRPVDVDWAIVALSVSF